MNKPAILLALLALSVLAGVGALVGRAVEQPRVALSAAERAWLDQNPDKLTLLYNIDFPPLEYASPQGDFAGLGAEVIAKLEKRLGVTFRKRPSADWSQHLADLESGACAVAPTIVRTAERERYAFFSPPYATAPVVIITTRATEDNLTLDDLAGRRVAVVSGYATERYVRDRARGRFAVTPVQTVREGLRQVAFGRADALVENIAVAAYYIEQESLPNLRVAGSTDYAFAWSIGVSRQYPLLFGAIEKALAAIPESELEVARRRWIALGVNDGPSSETVRLLELAALFAGSLLLGLTGITYVLKRRLDEKVASLRQAHEELRASEQRFRDIANNIPGVVYQFYARPTGELGLYYFSARASEIFGIEPRLEDAFARFAAHVAPEDRESFLASVQRAVATSQPWDFEGRFIKPTGDAIWFKGVSSPKQLAQELVFTGIMLDITERKRAEERQRLAAAVFEAAREAILVTDPDGRIVAVNPAFTALTGYAETDVLGRSPRLLWAERQPATYFADLWRTVSQEGVWHGEFWIRRKDGGRRAALASLATVRDAAQQIIRYVGIATDITAAKAAEQRIEHLAYYDALTDLPNRALLAQRAELALALAARRGETLAVLFLDLDRFKEVNDSMGHAEGDALLVQVAARLRALTRTEDTICRLGGDEFVLLLPDADQDGALRVADKLLAAFRQPFAVAGHDLQITVSIGIALYPHDGADFAELLKNADAALYQAKTNGRNDRLFYDRQMNAATFERLLLDAELRKAIAAGQLRAYYQPKVRLADGMLVGAEALVRWQHPVRGLIPPGQFIPVAEASDLIVVLEDWMLAEVCRQMDVWRRQGLPALTVAVNLAARHFRRPGLDDRLRGLLEAYCLPARTLELELTESTLLEASADTTATLAALERLGVGLALDDFGTGYSSLSYLKRLPLTALKIDRSFVRDLVSDPDDRVLAATIVTLGHQMELEVVAEGVETEEQRRILIEQGCDLAQGYLFGHPMPADRFAEWVGHRLADPSIGATEPAIE